MITVSYGPAAVESDLRHGRLQCPRCVGVLGPWGKARTRVIRGDLNPVAVRRVQPFRARCHTFKVTDVLLPVLFAARRADEAQVIALGLELWIAHRWGHRRIAALLGRPVSTVRGWLRAFARSAPSLAAWFMRLLLREAGDAAGVWPTEHGGSTAGALGVLVAHARVFTERLAPAGVMVPWHGAALAAATRREC